MLSSSAAIFSWMPARVCNSALDDFMCASLCTHATTPPFVHKRLQSHNSTTGKLYNQSWEQEYHQMS